MSSASSITSASPRLLRAYLAAFERLALQPRDEWHGFFVPRSESMNFGLRFQLAFPCYAAAAIARAVPEERDRCLQIMAGLVERMLDQRAWAYWAHATGSHDPVGRANIQYSGHLGHMLGLYELLGGDDRFKRPLRFEYRGRAVEYTHQQLVTALYEQMRRNHYHGVECEPGNTYVACTDHALWATVLHDRLHGTAYAKVNSEWLAFLERRLAFRGPRVIGRGAVTAIYFTRLQWAAPLGLNFMDAWSLAFMAPLAPELTRRLARRLWPGLRGAGNTLCLPSAPLWTRMEGSDTAVNTGFAYVLAVELGEHERARRLRAYAEQHLQPIEHGGARMYLGGLAAPYTTALFALGDAGGLTGPLPLAPSPRPLPALSP